MLAKRGLEFFAMKMMAAFILTYYHFYHSLLSESISAYRFIFK